MTKEQKFGQELDQLQKLINAAEAKVRNAKNTRGQVKDTFLTSALESLDQVQKWMEESFDRYPTYQFTGQSFRTCK